MFKYFNSGQRPDGSNCCHRIKGTIFTICLLVNPPTFHLQLAGADDKAIAEDYALTRVGREQNRQIIIARLSKEPLFASNNEAALNMFTCRYVTE